MTRTEATFSREIGDILRGGLSLSARAEVIEVLKAGYRSRDPGRSAAEKRRDVIGLAIVCHLNHYDTEDEAIEVTRLTAASKKDLQHELLDLITLMPDTQTQAIVEYIGKLRQARAVRDRP